MSIKYNSKLKDLIKNIKNILGDVTNVKEDIDSKQYNFLYNLRQNELIKYNNNRFHYYALLDDIYNCVCPEYLYTYSKDKQFIYSKLYPVHCGENEITFLTECWFRFIHIRFPTFSIREEYFKWMENQYANINKDIPDNRTILKPIRQSVNKTTKDDILDHMDLDSIRLDLFKKNFQKLIFEEDKHEQIPIEFHKTLLYFLDDIIIAKEKGYIKDDVDSMYDVRVNTLFLELFIESFRQFLLRMKAP